MKKLMWLCSLFLVLGGMTMHAQPREQIESRRIAYISRILELTPAEAQQFWPVYNAYKAEMAEVQKKKNSIQKGVRQALKTKSDNELESTADEYISLAVTQAQIQANYHEQFKKVLPIRKVVLLYKTEQDFNRKVLEEIRRRQEERKNRR